MHFLFQMLAMKYIFKCIQDSMKAFLYGKITKNN